jgi:mannuronan synthase
MNVSPSLQVTHESETQRQFVRFIVPSRVLLDGKEYEVRDISTGGIALRGVNREIAKGQIVRLELKLPFEGFNFAIALDAEVRHYVPGKGALGCRFVNLTARQTSFLNHFIKSFIAGDVVTVGGILNVATRNNFTKMPASANKNAAPATFRRQLPGLLVVAALGCLIAAFIGENLYSSIFVVRADNAAVAGPAVAVRSQTSGFFRSQLDPDLTLVKQNQVIGTVTPPSGPATTVYSPCNCYIAKAETASGESVTQGAKILSLMPVDATPWVIAQLDPALAKRIGPSTVATVAVFGARTPYTGHIVAMESPLAEGASGGNNLATMKIALDQKLPVDYVNRLATVTFAIH